MYEIHFKIIKGIWDTGASLPGPHQKPTNQDPPVTFKGGYIILKKLSVLIRSMWYFELYSC